MAAMETFEINETQLEQVVNAALGRHVRIMALLGCVLTVGGFVLGHFVAGVQARAVSERLESRINELQRQVTHLDGRCDRQEAETQRTLSALADVQRLRQAEARQDRETLSALIDDVRRRAAESLKQVEPYVARRLYLPPQQVAQLVNQFVEEQVRQMSTLLEIQDRRVTVEVVAKDRRPVAPLPPVEARPPAAAAREDGNPLMSLNGAAGSEAAVPSTRAAPEPEPETTAAPLSPAEPSGSKAAPAAQYISPPPRRGFLFFSPSQPGRLDPDRLSESDAIPLPPR